MDCFSIEPKVAPVMSDRRQRQKEMRAAKREAERKHEARKELVRRLVTALVFGVVVVGIFTFGDLFGGGDVTELPALMRTTGARKRLAERISPQPKT